MKSVLSGRKKKEKLFPKLMSARNGEVVLFSKANVGVCVHSGSTLTDVGAYSKDYTMSPFTDYEGNVCLTNEEP